MSVLGTVCENQPSWPFYDKNEQITIFFVMITFLQMSKNLSSDVFGTLRGLAAIQAVQGVSAAGVGQGEDADRERPQTEGQAILQSLEYFNEKLVEQKNLQCEQVLVQLKLKYEKKPATQREVNFTKKLSFGFEDLLELLAEDAAGNYNFLTG